MSDDASKDPKPFDLPTLKILAELMSQHDMSEVDLSEGTSRIRLRRGPRRDDGGDAIQRSAGCASSGTYADACRPLPLPINRRSI